MRQASARRQQGCSMRPCLLVLLLLLVGVNSEEIGDALELAGLPTHLPSERHHFILLLQTPTFLGGAGPGAGWLGVEKSFLYCTATARLGGSSCCEVESKTAIELAIGRQCSCVQKAADNMP
jgi:hypothetical protein